MDNADDKLSHRAAPTMHAVARLEQPLGTLAEAMHDIESVARR